MTTMFNASQSDSKLVTVISAQVWILEELFAQYNISDTSIYRERLREGCTFEAELPFTSTVIPLFLICDWISPSIRSPFFVLVAVIACIEKFKGM
jgi:hypothetical protein